MKSIAFGHMGLVVLTIRFHERPNVLHGSVESVSNLLEGREVGTLGNVHLRLHSLSSREHRVDRLAQS